MTTHVYGASKRAVSPRRVLVTGGSGFTGRGVTHAPPGVDVTVAGKRRDIPVRHTSPDPGEMTAVIAGICAPRLLGCGSAHDSKSGRSTVSAEFSEAEK
jgi:hypothetical protein